MGAMGRVGVWAGMQPIQAQFFFCKKILFFIGTAHKRQFPKCIACELCTYRYILALDFQAFM